MTPASFIAWRTRLKLRANAAAKALGCSPNSITAWERGKTPIPRYIALACAAIAFGLPPID
jgi:transcriptional regulator with XRE-family HTH domain